MTSKSTIGVRAAGIAAAVGVSLLPAGAYALDCDDLGITWAPADESWNTVVTLPTSPSGHNSIVGCVATWGTLNYTRDSWRIDCILNNKNTSVGGDDDLIYTEFRVFRRISTNPELWSQLVPEDQVENSVGGTVDVKTKCGTLTSGNTADRLTWTAWQGVNGQGEDNDLQGSPSGNARFIK